MGHEVRAHTCFSHNRCVPKALTNIAPFGACSNRHGTLTWNAIRWPRSPVALTFASTLLGSLLLPSRATLTPRPSSAARTCGRA